MTKTQFEKRLKALRKKSEEVGDEQDFLLGYIENHIDTEENFIGGLPLEQIITTYVAYGEAENYLEEIYKIIWGDKQ